MSNQGDTGNAGGAIAWMAGHSVAANLVMAICLIGGFMSLRQIKQEVFPELDHDAVSITVPYPGASPQDVESGILLSIEEVIRALDGVDEISSVAREGAGVVTAEILLGEDSDDVAQDIQGEVDRITTFPEDIEEPQVRVVSRRRDVLSVVLYGQVSKKVLHQLGERLRDRLLEHESITQAELSGLPPIEIQIEISQEELRRYGLTLGGVAGHLRDAAVDLPGGGLKTESGEVLVRMKERRDYGREFGQIPIISTPDGSELLLRDIAVIDDGFADTDRYARFNGQPAIMVDVYRIGDQTPIEVSEATKAQLAEFLPSLPPGLGAEVLSDRSKVYRQRVHLLLRNGSIGLVLVLLILGLFLEARLAFWVMMGIPISFLGSFLVLPATGVSINMVSLFAYIIALGIVVDDAIVVGENIYHYHQEGEEFLKAAILGAREVARPVIFSILTNIVTFLPLYVIPGFMGKVFRMIPLVVCSVFLISLGESLFILPAHLGHQRERHRHGLSAWLHSKQQAFSHGFRHWVTYRYGPFLEYVLHRRYLTITVATSILMVSLGYALSGRMGMSLFPSVESDFSEASLVMPYGTPVEKTEAVARRILEGAHRVRDSSKDPEVVSSIRTQVGRGGSHTCRIRVELADPEIRDKTMSTAEFTRLWREGVGEVPGVEMLRFRDDARGPGSHSSPLAVELSHRDIEVLEKASAKLAKIVATYPLVSDVDDGFQPGKQQLDFAVLPEGKSLGLTARGVARQVRNAFYGAEVVRQQRGRNEMKVMVRLPEAERSTEQTIRDLLVRTPGGTDVPLREVVEVRRGRAYTTIDRRNGRRVVVVTGNVNPRSKASEVITSLRSDVLPGLKADFPGLTCSFEGHQADMRESVSSLKVTFALALLVIYALLAIPFRSYIQPLVVMVSIPFGIVGALAGHLIMGYSLSLLSLFGIVALSGVVVNDSLILIDFANRLRAENGGDVFEAVHAAALQRFRPILLTTMTTFGGLAPMIFETSFQARFLIPMALSLGYGILFATMITLLLVPSLYVAMDDVRRGMLAVRRAAGAEPPSARVRSAAP